MTWPTVEEAIAYLGLVCTPDQFRAAFTIASPRVLSFSGGRTSALMLWCHLVAHGGQLPAYVVVVFANTSKEREETLCFVHDCGSRWQVAVRWVEWRAGADGRGLAFEEVGYNSATRDGSVLAAIFERWQRLPNHLARFCSDEAKRRTINRFVREGVGWRTWSDGIGFRFDEGGRILKLLSRNPKTFGSRPTRLPLAAAGIKKRHVAGFWSRQGAHDLQLQPHEGNCDLCFEKGQATIMALVQAGADPGWWAQQESRHGETFLFGRSYDSLAREAADQGPQPLAELEEYDVECGDMCASDRDPMAKAALQREFERAFAGGELQL